MRSVSTLALLRTVLMAGLAVFTLFPLLVVASTSLKTLGEVFQSPATLIPRAFVWHNYVDIFVRIPMARHLLNSLFIALAAVIFQHHCGDPGGLCNGAHQVSRARSIRHEHPSGADVFAGDCPHPLFEMMKALQLLDTYTALILVNTAITLPFSIWMLRGFFKNIPEELEDAAMIDGLSRTGMIFRIALPLTGPRADDDGYFYLCQRLERIHLCAGAGFQTDHAADYNGALCLGKKQRGRVELFDGHRGGGDGTYDLAVPAGEKAVDRRFDVGCG